MKTKSETTALLSVRLTVDSIDRETDVYAYIKLYREEDGLIWRMDGPLGDECETLPRPASVAQGKADVRSVYPKSGPFKPIAAWL